MQRETIFPKSPPVFLFFTLATFLFFSMPLVVAESSTRSRIEYLQKNYKLTKDIQPLIWALKDRDDAVRLEAAMILRNLGAPAIEPLVQVLRDKDRLLRRRAVWILSEIGTPAVDSLIEAIKLEKNIGQSAAAEALIKIGPTAVEPLIGALKNGKGDERLNIVQVLGKTRDPRTVEPLVELLEKKESATQGMAARALGAIGDKRAIGPLVAALRQDDGLVRLRAAEALGNIGWESEDTEERVYYLIAKREWAAVTKAGKPAIGPLIKVLEINDARIREGAAEALGNMGDIAVEPLIKAMEVNDSWVRMGIITAFKGIGNSAVPSLVAVLKKEEVIVRGVAADVLDEIGWQPEDAEARVYSLIARQEWGAVAEAGAATIAPLLKELKRDNRWVRGGAAFALGELGDERAIEPLIEILGDERVQKQVIEALSKFGTSALEPLTRALEHSDHHVRNAAARTLEIISSEK